MSSTAVSDWTATDFANIVPRMARYSVGHSVFNEGLRSINSEWCNGSTLASVFPPLARRPARYSSLYLRAGISRDGVIGSA